MQLKYLLSVVLVLAIIVTQTRSVEGRRIKLRPLSAREVYRILKEAGREDAVPEGRVVTQGIAAMTGFALGVTKGIGGSLLFDLATSNATSEFINNFNMSALPGLFTFGSTTNTTSGGVTYQTQEICFNSRSAEPGLEGRNAEYNENDKYGRQATTATPTGTTPTTGTATGTATPTATSGTPSPTVTNTPVTSPTTSTSVSYSPTGSVGTATSSGGTGTGTVTGTNTGGGTGTTVDTGTATNTVSDTVTDTGTGSTPTCIVIQKPKARKRRSSHRRRRH